MPKKIYCCDDVAGGISGRAGAGGAGTQPTDIRASFLRITRLIEAEGIHKLREPYAKHLEGPVWKMRMKGRDGIARAAYVTASGQRVVVVHVFAKKTRKTPRREIEIALKRAKEVT
jgi:phage-related protein